jgi:branched-chain amino acid transport system ATP-binding protein
MLRLEAVSAGYAGVPVLREVSLEVKEGELVTLIGANGAGKSTTLKTISGLVRATHGRIHFDGQDLTTASARRILAAGIAHCPEGRRVFPQMTVEENLEMGFYLRRDAAETARDLEVVLERFPILAERRSQAAGLLSGGEQQVLAIGRALMSRPRLIMFDEPSLGLAPQLVETTFDIVRSIRERGTTVLMVEQNAYAALEMCDRAYLLETGEVVLQGTGASLLDDPHVRTAYLGG